VAWALRWIYTIHRMEWTIPLQNLDITNINISKPTQGSKLISSINYCDGSVTFNSLCILLPNLLVKSYDTSSGRLQISIQNPGFMAKLQAFQEMLIQSVYTNQQAWFPGVRNSQKEDIRHGFQPFVEHGSIHLYYPSSTSGISNEIYTYAGKNWIRKAISPEMFTAGKVIRLVIKIQGLSFHQHSITGAWTGKFRLQHRICALMTT
jgi:hypothetical protein